jgi:hypothetical protein
MVTFTVWSLRKMQLRRCDQRDLSFQHESDKRTMNDDWPAFESMFSHVKQLLNKRKLAGSMGPGGGPNRQPTE